MTISTGSSIFRTRGAPRSSPGGSRRHPADRPDVDIDSRDARHQLADELCDSPLVYVSLGFEDTPLDSNALMYASANDGSSPSKALAQKQWALCEVFLRLASFWTILSRVRVRHGERRFVRCDFDGPPTGVIACPTHSGIIEWRDRKQFVERRMTGTLHRAVFAYRRRRRPYPEEVESRPPVPGSVMPTAGRPALVRYGRRCGRGRAGPGCRRWRG